MREILIGDTPFHVFTVREGARWRARATAANNRQFGPDVTAVIEAEAVDRLTNWLRWQHAHGEALATLQQAEQAYHRVQTGAAEGVSADLLAAIDAARSNLDVIRGRRPAV